MRIFVISVPDDDVMLIALEKRATEISAEDLAKLAAPSAPAYHVPGPYEIALAVGASLAASDKFQTPGAALQAAWSAVPEFYMGRDYYLKTLGPAVFGMSAPEGSADGAAAKV